MPVLIAQEGPQRGLVLDLAEGDEWIIGRDPDTAHFVIEDNTVSRKHARLNKTAEGIFLENLSKVNPVLVNEEELSERVLLKEGDRVQVGNTVFLFSEKKKEKKKGGYDNIFGDLDEPEEDEPEEEEETPPAEEPERTPLPRSAEEAMPPTPPKPPEASVYDTIFEEAAKKSPSPSISLPNRPSVESDRRAECRG